MHKSFVIPTTEINPQEYYWYKNGFSKSQLTKLNDDLSTLKFQKAVTFGETAENTSKKIRSSRVKWIPQDERFKWIYELMNKLIMEANKNLWNFDVHTMLEQIQYTEYLAEEQGHYTWHQDIGPGNASKRKISVTIQLSEDDEYEGGDLEIWKGGTSIQKCERGAGVAVLFPSYMMHRVTPITKGIRKSLVLWVGGSHYK
jgi:PKHD-type hydroxylase|tara:strand:- start:4700 stop:5299 length:600 start_codon:yes stop_codon:yes gene_type:complete